MRYDSGMGRDTGVNFKCEVSEGGGGEAWLFRDPGKTILPSLFRLISTLHDNLSYYQSCLEIREA